MTIKQKKFADEYIISGNATESYKRAGYKHSSDNVASVEGLKLLRNPKVKSYIDEKMAELEDKAIAKQGEILKYLTSVMRGESISCEVVVEGSGDGCSEARLIDKTPSEKEKIKAAELLGKRYGTWTEKFEVDADMELNVKVDYGSTD